MFQSTIDAQTSTIAQLSTAADSNVMDLNSSLFSLANAAAMQDDVEANYVTQSAAASMYVTQATLSNYATITQATAMAASVRTYAETLVEVSPSNSPCFFKHTLLPCACASTHLLLLQTTVERIVKAVWSSSRYISVPSACSFDATIHSPHPYAHVIPRFLVNLVVLCCPHRLWPTSL